MSRRPTCQAAWPAAAAVALCVASQTAVWAAPSVVNLSAGQQQTVTHHRAIKRVAIGNPEVAGVSAVADSAVLLTAKKPGSTTLSIWDAASGATPALQLEVLVAPSALAAQRDAKAGQDHLEVSAEGTKLKLSGALSSLERHAQAAAAVGDAEAQKQGQVVDATTTGYDVQVQIDVKIVEVSRSKLMEAGVFFSRNTARNTYAVSAPGNLAGIEKKATDPAFTLLSNSSFLPKSDAFNFLYGSATKGLLNAVSVLEANGFAYSLAEPSLTALSGQTAYFLAGGELPIPMRSGSGGEVTVQFKEFGVRLNLTPTVLDAERMVIKVAPEVSEIDKGVAVEVGGFSIPGLRVRRTETTVALGSGESFVISGLVTRQTIANVDKVPGLGDLPILGSFFKSNRFEREDKELLMIATPHLVRPFARNAALPPLPGEALRGYDPSFLKLLGEKGRFEAGGGGFSE